MGFSHLQGPSISGISGLFSGLDQVDQTGMQVDTTADATANATALPANPMQLDPPPAVPAVAALPLCTAAFTVMSKIGTTSEEEMQMIENMEDGPVKEDLIFQMHNVRPKTGGDQAKNNAKEVMLMCNYSECLYDQYMCDLYVYVFSCVFSCYTGYVQDEAVPCGYWRTNQCVLEHRCVCQHTSVYRVC